MKDTFFSRNKHIQTNGNLISLPCVMGIINVNADSFFSGSRADNEVNWLKMSEKHLTEGASIIDIGATSTRPGASISDVQKEEEIIEKVLNSILKNFPDCNISVDTYHQKVAKKAIQTGAAMINDISGGQMDDQMLPYILKNNIPYIAMHSKGTPETMQSLANYEDVVAEVYKYLKNIENQFQDSGHSQLILDPGLGFAKTIDHNFEILKRLEIFRELTSPIMIGISRKSSIYKTLNTSAENALNGTTVLNTIAVLNGADILRVHDVKEAMEVLQLTEKIN